jgi:hypothetical protein
MYAKDRWKAKKMIAHFKSLYQQLPGQTQDYIDWPDEVPVWETSNVNLGLYRRAMLLFVVIMQGLPVLKNCGNNAGIISAEKLNTMTAAMIILLLNNEFKSM